MMLYKTLCSAVSEFFFHFFFFIKKNLLQVLLTLSSLRPSGPNPLFPWLNPRPRYGQPHRQGPGSASQPRNINHWQPHRQGPGCAQARKGLHGRCLQQWEGHKTGP